MQMLASGHQAPALQVIPRRTSKAAQTCHLLGERTCRISNTQRLRCRQKFAHRALRNSLKTCQASAAAAPVIEKVELDARVAVVLGTQWGDEGKGKLVDILAQKYEIVARAQVGNLSAHMFLAAVR